MKTNMLHCYCSNLTEAEEERSSGGDCTGVSRVKGLAWDGLLGSPEGHLPLAEERKVEPEATQSEPGC